MTSTSARLALTCVTVTAAASTDGRVVAWTAIAVGHGLVFFSRTQNATVLITILCLTGFFSLVFVLILFLRKPHYAHV